MTDQGMGGTINRVTEDDKLRGVRGWLLCFCIFWGIGFFQSIPMLYALAYDMQVSSEGRAVGIFVYSYALFGVFSLIAIWREKRYARYSAIVLMLLSAYFSAANMSAAEEAAPFTDWLQLAGSLLWVAYFIFSRRVKVTLVN